jgi:hypothetical protein
LQEELYPRVRAILDAPDMDTAWLLLEHVLESYESKAAKAMRILEAGFEDATAVLMLPERYRKRLRTINEMERINEKIRRRERVIRIFPNEGIDNDKRITRITETTIVPSVHHRIQTLAEFGHSRLGKLRTTQFLRNLVYFAGRNTIHDHLHQIHDKNLFAPLVSGTQLRREFTVTDMRN